MGLIQIVVLLWVLGFWATFALMFWAATHIEGAMNPWRVLIASALWFLTLPLAWVVVSRLREALPYLRAYAATGAIPIVCEVVVRWPPSRVMTTLGDVVSRETQ